jgi:hypothetical protein
MEKITEVSQFTTQLRCFKAIGFKIGSEFKPFPSVATNIIKFLNVFSLIFCCSWEALFITRNIKNILISAEAAGTILLSMISLSKLIIFSLWKEKSLKLIQEVKKMAVEGNF